MSARFFLCPGRGSYAKGELGTLARLAEQLGDQGRDALARIEAQRKRLDDDLPSLIKLDSAPEFRSSLHLPGRNASPLIFACSVLDAMREERSAPPIVVAGNSLGFYSALVVSGALELEEGMRLVSTMARLQELGANGGQILWTRLDEDWRALPERRTALDELLAELRGRGLSADVSIELGGHVVLAGDEDATRALLEELPKVTLGKREFPFRLPFHGPFHTPLLAPVAEAAAKALDDLALERPRVPLVDGRGFVWSPLASDLGALKDYTIGAQVTTTFDFSTMCRVVLSDFAPDENVLLAPGSSLRAPLGHVEGFIDRGEAIDIASRRRTQLPS